MKNLDQQIKNYVIPMVVFIVVVAMVPLFIMPTLEKIAQASKVINANAKRLDSLKKKAADLELLKETEEELTEKLKVAESALPVDKSIVPLIHGVKELASSSKLAVVSFKIQPGKTATSSAEKNSSPIQAQGDSRNPKLTSRSGFIFQITLNGKSADFISFIRALENAKRLMLVQEFRGTAKDGGNYEIEVFINAPFGSRPKISDDQEAAPLPKLTASNEKLLEDLKSNIFTDVTAVRIEPGPTGVVDPFR